MTFVWNVNCGVSITRLIILGNVLLLLVSNETDTSNKYKNVTWVYVLIPF